MEWQKQYGNSHRYEPLRQPFISQSPPGWYNCSFIFTPFQPASLNSFLHTFFGIYTTLHFLRFRFFSFHIATPFQRQIDWLIFSWYYEPSFRHFIFISSGWPLRHCFRWLFSCMMTPPADFSRFRLLYWYIIIFEPIRHAIDSAPCHAIIFCWAADYYCFFAYYAIISILRCHYIDAASESSFPPPASTDCSVWFPSRLHAPTPASTQQRFTPASQRPVCRKHIIEVPQTRRTKNRRKASHHAARLAARAACCIVAATRACEEAEENEERIELANGAALRASTLDVRHVVITWCWRRCAAPASRVIV